MIINNKTITISEYEQVYYDELKLKTKYDLSGMKNEIEGINKKLKAEVIQLGWKKFQAKHYVGFIKLKRFTIQIVPKIFITQNEFEENYTLNDKNLDFLLFILQYIKKDLWKIKQYNVGLLSDLHGNLFEFFIYFFAKNLKELLKRGIKKSYVITIENRDFLKGKLLVKDQLRYNIVQNWKFICKFEEFTENNLINQILKYVSFILRNHVINSKTKKLLEDVLSYFIDVDLKSIKPSDFNKIHFNRITSSYKPYINLCKIFINQGNIGFRSNDLMSFYFIFDMNKLFESFLSEFIKNNIQELKINKQFEIINIKDQYIIGKMFDLFKLKPDLWIKYKIPKLDSPKFLLIDFKYKILKSELKRLGIAQSDVYQMFAYSQSQNTKYNNVILFYPKAEFEKFDIKPSYHHFKKNCKFSLYIETLDLQKIFEDDKGDIWKKNLINEINRIFSKEF